jgi:hypothetical protein
LGKTLNSLLSISHSLNAKTKPCPELDPIKKDKVASLEHLIKLNLEDDAEFFIKEEDEDLIEPKPLDELLEHLNLPLTSNLCLPVLDMFFSIMTRNLH